MRSQAVAIGPTVKSVESGPSRAVGIAFGRQNVVRSQRGWMIGFIGWRLGQASAVRVWVLRPGNRRFQSEADHATYWKARRGSQPVARALGRFETCAA